MRRRGRGLAGRHRGAPDHSGLRGASGGAARPAVTELTGMRAAGPRLRDAIDRAGYYPTAVAEGRRRGGRGSLRTWCFVHARATTFTDRDRGAPGTSRWSLADADPADRRPRRRSTRGDDPAARPASASAEADHGCRPVRVSAGRDDDRQPPGAGNRPAEAVEVTIGWGGVSRSTSEAGRVQRPRLRGPTTATPGVWPPGGFSLPGCRGRHDSTGPWGRRRSARLPLLPALPPLLISATGRH